MTSKLKLTFINPPHADWCLPNFVTWFSIQSHYSRYGKYSDKIEWLKPPYRFNEYESIDQIINEVKGADVILFSSYIWNYDLCDQIAKKIKHLYPEKILIIGGPQMGTLNDELLRNRQFYDYYCKPTKPGEIFIETFIDAYFEARLSPKEVAWELRSELTKDFPLPDYSIYRDHFEFITELNLHARSNSLEPFIVIETTRGCPYQCVFCEWGGGTGTKVIAKDLAIVKKDIMALKEAGFSEAYLTDANFGIFEARDIEIFRYAHENQFALTDISTVKSKSLERRKRIVDAWFEIVGKEPETGHPETGRGSMTLTGFKYNFISSLPTVSIQSISDLAMKVAKRVDLNFNDKLTLSEHIRKRCHQEGYPVPALELILAMPGSTLNDFYQEFEIIWNFKAWTSFRHDYMFLPDTEISSPAYLEKYQIETVEVFTDLVDEEGVDNLQTLYAKKRNYFRTIRNCFSFTTVEMEEMFFMNHAGNFLLEQLFPSFESVLSPSEFGKKAFRIIKQLAGFRDIFDEIHDIYDPYTPPRNIKKLSGQLRNVVISELLKKHQQIIYNELFRITYGNEETFTESEGRPL